MTQKTSPGKIFRDLLSDNAPLQIAGTINAYCALLARKAGFKAIYLSGAGVANASYGLADLGITTLDDVCIDTKRITQCCDLPLLVDADTGWDDPANTVKQLTMAGAAGMHIEDQIELKRCGHRPGKNLVSSDEMVERITAAVDSRRDNDFVIMARTDAYSVEGIDAAITRSKKYIDAGADMIFAEAFISVDDYKIFTSQVAAPVLANMTEFGNTPLLDTQELRDCGISMALYPLSAFRSMSQAALHAYHSIIEDGSQVNIIKNMQLRDELYTILDYKEQEKNLDNLIKEHNKNTDSDT